MSLWDSTLSRLKYDNGVYFKTKLFWCDTIIIYQKTTTEPIDLNVFMVVVHINVYNNHTTKLQFMII